MSKQSDVRWDEPSDPEISVAALLPGESDEAKTGNLVGERFGKYLLVGEIALGGMAELFLAVHKGLEGFIKVVVIKRVLPQFNDHHEFVRMFIDEARLAARLEHPNIVRTYEFGEFEGLYFTAMEYLPGEDLCKVLNRLSVSRQVIPIHVATGIATQLCVGLHFAHQFTDIDGRPLNLVHRDINPANVVVTYGGEVKIIDFGVAKSNANRQTVTGTIKGKVAYMPPEQVLGRSVDHRADIFSAGVVLWEMLTGRPLFLRDNEAATLYAIMNGPVPPPSKFRRDIPPELDEIVLRALARSPADRYRSAEDMAAALENFSMQLPRYDTRVLAGLVEELFGSTRAEAKRSIAQTRSLTRNITLVMKLRSEVRADLAERIDGAVSGEPIDDQTLRHRSATTAQLPSPATEAAPARRWTIAAAAGVLAGIAAGLVYLMPSSQPEPASKPAAASTLRIDSTPPGAAVFVAGEPTGLKTPTTLNGVTAKQLAIRLELPGHAPASAEIDLPSGGSGARHFTLTPLPSRLVISGLPANASVVVDDEEHAAGEVITVPAGPHTVRIVIDDRTITQQSIDAGAGDQAWKLVHGKLVAN